MTRVERYEMRDPSLGSHHVRVEHVQGSHGIAHVYVDGRELHVSECRVEFPAGGDTKVTLELLIDDDHFEHKTIVQAVT